MILCEAAARGDVVALEQLLDRGANVHAENDEALRFVALAGHFSAVQLLLDRSANGSWKKKNPTILFYKRH